MIDKIRKTMRHRTLKGTVCDRRSFLGCMKIPDKREFSAQKMQRIFLCSEKSINFSDSIKSLKDRKILALILENARIPITELARKTRLSKEVVQYRLKNLEKNLIVGYQARINLKFFCDSVYTIYLNIPGLKREEIIERLQKLPRCNWVGSSLGRWNYIISFSTDKKNNLQNFMDKLYVRFPNQNIKYILTEQLKEFKDSLSGVFGKNEFWVSHTETEKFELDNLDLKIIGLLTKNARSSNSEIAGKIGLTREAVRNRIKKLEKLNIIQNYRTMISLQHLNLETYILAIKCRRVDSSSLTKLCEFMSENPSIIYVCLTSGEINILSTICTRTMKELDFICSSIRLNFPDLIEELEPLPIVEVNTQEYFPKGQE